MITQLCSIVLFILYLALFPFLSWILPTSRPFSQVSSSSRHLYQGSFPSRHLSQVSSSSRHLSGVSPSENINSVTYNRQRDTTVKSYGPITREGLMNATLQQAVLNVTPSKVSQQRLTHEQTQHVDPTMYAFLRYMPGGYFRSLHRDTAMISEARQGFATTILPLVQHTGDLHKDIQMTINRENRTPFGLGWFGNMDTDSIKDLLTNIDKYKVFMGGTFRNGRWEPLNHVALLKQRIPQLLSPDIDPLKKQYPWYLGVVESDYASHGNFKKLNQDSASRRTLLQDTQQALNEFPKDIKNDFRVYEANLRNSESIIRDMFSKRYLPINNSQGTILEAVEEAITKEALVPYGLAIFGDLKNMTDLVARIKEYKQFTRQKQWNYRQRTTNVEDMIQEYAELFLSTGIPDIGSIPIQSQEFILSKTYYERVHHYQRIIIQHIMSMELISLLGGDSLPNEYQGFCYDPTPKIVLYCELLALFRHDLELRDMMIRTVYDSRGFFRTIGGPNVWFSKTFLSHKYSSWKEFTVEFQKRFDKLFSNSANVRAKLKQNITEFDQKPPRTMVDPYYPTHKFNCKVDAPNKKTWLEVETIVYRNT